MEIDNLDRHARRAATLPGERPSGWTDAEVEQLRLIVQCVRAAQLVDDVLSLRSLRLRADDPPSGGRYRADLSADRAISLAFKTDGSPITAILDIVTTRTDPRR